MNVELLEKVKAFILEHPEHFDMARGLGSLKSGCGTTACIAGTACVLGLENPLSAYEDERPWEVWSRKFLPKEELDQLDELDIVWKIINKKAIELLDITEDQANELFFVIDWADDFKERHLLSRTSEEDAKIAAEYIDYFISKYNVVNPIRGMAIAHQ